MRTFDDLSDETRYRRFLAPIKQLTSDEITYFTEVDHRDHEALIALTADGEIVWIARYSRFGPESTGPEVAVKLLTNGRDEVSGPRSLPFSHNVPPRL